MGENACAHGIQIDGVRNLQQGLFVALDQHALGSSFPKRPGALEAFVHVEGEAQLHILEEKPQIPTAVAT